MLKSATVETNEVFVSLHGKISSKLCRSSQSAIVNAYISINSAWKAFTVVQK